MPANLPITAGHHAVDVAGARSVGSLRRKPRLELNWILALGFLLAADHATAVTGEASYTAKIATPPGAVFEALLSGRVDSEEPTLLARQRVLDVASPPFEIVLPYGGDADHLIVDAVLRLPDGRLFFAGWAAVEDGSATVVMNRAGDTSSRGLVGPQWRLFRLGEEIVATVEDERAVPYLMFEGSGNVVGQASCNNLTGGYKLDATGVLQFGELSVTLAACPEPLMVREAVFLDLLAATENFAIDGDRLTLIAGGVPLAVFVAEPDFSSHGEP